LFEEANVLWNALVILKLNFVYWMAYGHRNILFLCLK